MAGRPTYLDLEQQAFCARWLERRGLSADALPNADVLIEMAEDYAHCRLRQRQERAARARRSNTEP